jgi:hypothetical protein
LHAQVSGGWGYQCMVCVQAHALDLAHGQHHRPGRRPGTAARPRARPAITTGSTSTKRTPSTWRMASTTGPARDHHGQHVDQVHQLDRVQAHALDLEHGQHHRPGRRPDTAARPGATARDCHGQHGDHMRQLDRVHSRLLVGIFATPARIAPECWQARQGLPGGNDQPSIFGGIFGGINRTP